MQNSKLKNQNFPLTKIFAFLLAILTFNFCLFNLEIAFATTSSNPNYNLEIDDINTSPQKPENHLQFTPTIADYEEIEDPVGGIKNIAQTAPIIFSVSSEIVDFGILSPGNPVTRNSTLSIFSDSIDYQIIAFENHPLTGPDNQIIPDTTCDNGSCSEQESSIWANQLTYGFGFRCASKSDFMCVGFSEDNSYRQFSDLQKQETPQGIIIGKKDDETKNAQVTFKLNTSGNQKTGSYENTVTFIAVPSY